MACEHCHVDRKRVEHAIKAATGQWNVSCATSGAFEIDADARWPAPFHYVDSGLARIILEIVGTASLLDVGAGSGQYGAWFEAARQRGEPAPSYSAVDGATNIEAFTRAHGPPGALVRHHNLCDPAAPRLQKSDLSLIHI